MTDLPDTSAVRHSSPLLGWLPDRVANLAWSALFGAPIALAALIEPSSKGFGTHQQLGMPPCTFLWMTGFPCPFCGMTTSWAHAARGDIAASVATQPMGFFLFAVTCALALATLVNAARGGARFRLERLVTSIPLKAWWSGLAALFVAWIYKSALVRGWI